MASKSTAARKEKTPSQSILFRYRERDSSYGVSRKTAGKLGRELGLSETQVIHVALARLAEQTLPKYEADAAPLSRKELKAIKKLVRQGRMKVKDSLF
jgi:hypothetical protein